MSGGGGAKPDGPIISASSGILESKYLQNIGINEKYITSCISAGIEKIYVFLDVSSSMIPSVEAAKQFLHTLHDKYGKQIKFIVVPFGYAQQEYEHYNGIAKNRYGVMPLSEFVNSKASWAKYATVTFALEMFLATDFGTDPFGMIFIGDGEFNYPNAQPFINSLKTAAVAGKLNNCGFLHFLYFPNAFCHYTCRNKRCLRCINKQQTIGKSLSDTFKTILSSCSGTVIPYSEGMTDTLPTKLNVCPDGYYGIGEFNILKGLYPQTIEKYIRSDKFPGLLSTMIIYMIQSMVTDPKLFLIEGSIYSIIHRVLSLMKDDLISDFMTRTEIKAVVRTANKYWTSDVFKITTRKLTVNDVYEKNIDSWAGNQLNKKEIFGYLSELRAKAFGGQSDFLTWLAKNTTTCVIIAPTSVKISSLEIHSMVDYVKFLERLFGCMKVIPADAEIPDGYSIVTYVSEDPNCCWNT
jgi:hypothetical protein